MKALDSEPAGRSPTASAHRIGIPRPDATTRSASEQIAQQIETRVPELSGVTALRRLTGGSSHETWSFEAARQGDKDWRSAAFILRREFEVALFDMPLETEFELLRQLRQAGVSVPEPFFVAKQGKDGTPPFMVMERIDGLDARKAMAASRDSEGRHAIGSTLVRALAKLHATPATSISVLLGSGIAQTELERWAGSVQESGYPSAVLHMALAWLAANCPTIDDPVIVHGDYKANNILLEGGHSPVIIDWELAHIGDRLEDLAWTMLWSTNEDLVGGMLSPSEFIAAYEATSGTFIDLERLRYWKIFALVKLAAIFLQGVRPIPGGKAPRPMLLMLAQSLPCIEEALVRLLARSRKEGGPV